MNYSKPVRYNDNPVTSNRKVRKVTHNILMSLGVPIVFTLIAIALTWPTGRFMFINMDHGGMDPILIKAFVKRCLLVLVAATALNTNLNSGRMDFALGATGILGSVLALQVTQLIGDGQNPLVLLAFTILFSMVLGLIHGLIYIVLKLPPIVVSLGMCLIFEGIAFVIAGGKSEIPLKFIGEMTDSWAFILISMVAVMIFMSIFLCYTKFGYNKIALVFDQRISVETGINEVRSAIICYIVAGALIGLYQFISASGFGNIGIKIDLGSSQEVFKNFLPIFIGGILAKYSNQIVGLSLAIFSTTILTEGMDNNAASVEHGFLTSTAITLITSFMVFGVLVYMVDKNRFINWLKMRKYVATEKYLNPVIKAEGEK